MVTEAPLMVNLCVDREEPSGVAEHMMETPSLTLASKSSLLNASELLTRLKRRALEAGR